ncbi:hypothetical protein ZWY2020_047439 [Hordeum vulgare]|nr:hypothetical protein ZWY2020_047439 [Hordeum vulgare]
MAAKSPSYYQTSPCQEVKQKEHLFHLYMDQHGEGKIGANQIVPVKGVAFGQTAVVDWSVRDGRAPEANIVARAKGTSILAAMSLDTWVMCYTLLFSDERFKGSSLQCMGSHVSNTDGQYAVVGGTGEFAGANGVVNVKILEFLPETTGVIRELNIRVSCPCSNPTPVTKIGPWGGNGGTTFDMADLPRSVESVQILVENKKNFDLTKALTLVAEVQLIRIDGDIINEVVQFVTRRLEQLLVDEGINCEIVRSVLMERANCPYLASQTAAEMEAFSRTKDFPKIVEAYSRPVRIIRGKKIESAWEVDANVFEKDEEKALWSAYLEVANKIHPGVDVKTFAESSLLLIQPLEDFFNNVFVMAEDEKIRNNRLALLQKVASLTKGIADLSVSPGF